MQSWFSTNSNGARLRAALALCPRPKPTLAGEATDVDAGERAAGERRQRADAVDRAGLGAVVVDQDADVEPGGLLADAGEELGEEIEVGPEGDDGDVNRDHGARASA